MRSTASVTAAPPPANTLISAVGAHWPEYMMEAACLAIFMLSACAFTVLFEHPGSPVHQAIDSPVMRRAFMGLAMGITAIAVIMSPFGRRSGAHMNPAVTLTYLSLGKMAWRDALFYVTAQFAGGIAGVVMADLLLGFPLRHSAVNYAVTQPGSGGPLKAFAAEVLISALLMATILVVSNHRRLAPLTPYFAGALLALYITIEAPLSGMSMNPARTLGSAYSAGHYASLWVYFAGPPLAMAAAGQVYRVYKGQQSVYCAKLDHNNNERCIFRCRYHQL